MGQPSPSTPLKLLALTNPPSPLRPSVSRSVMDRVIQRCELHSKIHLAPPKLLVAHRVCSADHMLHSKGSTLTNRVCSTDHMRWQMAPPKLLVTPLKLLAHYCSPRSLHQYIQCAQHFSTDHMRWQMAPPKLLVTPLKLLAHYCSPRSLHQYIQCAQHFSPDRQRNQCHVKVSARAVRENGATYLSQIDHYADRLARCWRWAGNGAKGSLHRPKNFAMDSLPV